MFRHRERQTIYIYTRARARSLCTHAMVPHAFTSFVTYTLTNACLPAALCRCLLIHHRPYRSLWQEKDSHISRRPVGLRMRERERERERRKRKRKDRLEEREYNVSELRNCVCVYTCVICASVCVRGSACIWKTAHVQTQRAHTDTHSFQLAGSPYTQSACTFPMPTSHRAIDLSLVQKIAQYWKHDITQLVMNEQEIQKHVEAD